MKQRRSPHPPQRKFKHYEFPYIRFHGKHYPLIPITLRRGRFFVSTFALLDSGASISVFRPEIHRALRLPTRHKEEINLGTANGAFNIGLSKVKIEVEETKFMARVGFSGTYAASFNIIGREGFFHKFSVCFNEMLKTVIMVPLDQIQS